MYASSGVSTPNNLAPWEVAANQPVVGPGPGNPPNAPNASNTSNPYSTAQPVMKDGHLVDPVTGHLINPTLDAATLKQTRDGINTNAEMQQAYNGYWNTVKPGDILDFAGGTLTMNPDGSATHSYIDGSGKQQSYTFNKNTDFATVAKSDPNIAREWKDMFNYTPPITVTPNIPGRPTDGFTGMTDVRNAYTAGGGNLGYTPYVPTSIQDFEDKYNKQTGGSAQAYNYLKGKSAYSATPYTPTGEIAKPYSESVMGIPGDITKKKYLFKSDGKGGGTYEDNPKFIPPHPYTKPAEGKEWSWDATNKKWAQVPIGSSSSSSSSSSLTDPKKPPTESPGEGYEWVWNGTKWVESQIGPGIANGGLAALTMARGGSTHPPFFSKTTGKFNLHSPQVYADGGAAGQYNLGGYSDGGRLLRGPGDGVSDSIPATIGNRQPAKLADGEFVVPARIVSELGNGSTEAGARKLYAMMDRVQHARRQSVGKGKVAKNSRADKYLPE